MAVLRDFKFPTEWSNEYEMSILFAPLPDRDDTTGSRKSKLAFWSAAIRSYAHQRANAREMDEDQQRLGFTVADVEAQFTRKDLETPCLVREVMKELHSEGAIKSSSSFLRHSWWDTVASVFRWIRGGDAPLPSGTFFYDDILKEMAIKLYDELSRDLHSSISRIFLDEDISRKLSCPLHPDDLDILLKQLEYERKINIFNRKGHNFRAVKVHDPGSYIGVTELDCTIADLKYSLLVVSKQESELADAVKEKRALVMEYLRSKQRARALGALNLQKRTESLLTRRGACVSNLERILYEIGCVESNKVVVDSMKLGARTLEDMRRAWGLSADSVAEVAASISESVEDHQEVDEIISRDISQNTSMAFDESELERELEQLTLDPCPDDPKNVLDESDRKGEFAESEQKPEKLDIVQSVDKKRRIKQREQNVMLS
eukprot:180259_1